MSSQQAHLNNSSQYQLPSQVNVSEASATVGAPLFAFHQNLYPNNMESGMSTNFRQECETPPQHAPAELIGSGGPRLYSTMATCDGNATTNASLQPLASSHQHNFNMQVELNKLSSPVGGRIVISQPALTPLAAASVAEAQSGMNGKTGGYSKYRHNNDGGI